MRFGRPRDGKRSVKKRNVSEVWQAYENYRSATILLGKFGFNAQAVWDMCHAEVSAWINSYLASQGAQIQHNTDETTTSYVFKRRKNKGA